MESLINFSDPTGMFSKAGKASQEMYQMIQQKDLILNPNNRPKYKHIKSKSVYVNNNFFFSNNISIHHKFIFRPTLQKKQRL